MRKLVIGCGYLGLRTADAWLAAGHDVFALTRSAERAQQLARQGIRPCVGDVTASDSLNDLPNVDRVLYAVGYDRRSSPTREQVLIDGLANTWRALRAKCQSWIYVSSTSVYGVSDGSFVDETTPCRPQTAAGQTCWAAEQSLQQRATASGVQHVVLRSAGLYGPDRLLRRVSDIKSGHPLSGRPDAFLNLVHVEDLVTAVLAAETYGQSGNAYLIADGQQLTRRAYFELLARLLDAPPPSFDPAARPERTSGLNKRCRIDKALNELHWKPKYPTAADGLRQALAAGCEP